VKNKKNLKRYLAIILSFVILMSLVSCNIINFSFATSSTVSSQMPESTVIESTTTREATADSAREGERVTSEYPNAAVFNEYFSELGLGKLPQGKSLPADLIKGDNVFTSNGLDQLVIYGTLLKDVKLSNAIYDVKSKKNIRQKSEFPMVMKKGGFAGSEPVNLFAGLFEYKMWVADKLVGVFPFEVRP